ncbi:MAG: hypothetical protein K0S44_730 [Bacteroidetes bacterium]|nr:hypothetical protein [Bacteroidota bacterium]
MVYSLSLTSSRLSAGRLLKFKGIKKLTNILFRLISILIFLSVLLFLLIQVKSIQTFAGHKAAAYLSKRLHTKVEIGSVDIEFVKTVVLTDVYIEDLHKDTLLYSKKLKVDLGELDFEKHKLLISNVVLLNTNASLIKYREDEDLNLQFIIDAFTSWDTAKTVKPYWDIQVSEITCVNTTFNYRNEHDTMITTGINFIDLGVNHINGRFTDIKLDHDTIRGTIEYLSAIEKSGFILKSLSSFVNVSPVGVKMDALKLRTAESNIATDLSFKYDQYSDFNNFINKVKLSAEFDQSVLEMNDLAYFAPGLKGLYKAITVTGKVTGKVSDLRGKKMDIYLGGSTHYIGDFAFTGLPNFDETLIHLNVENLSTNYEDLKAFPLPPFTEYHRLDLPANIQKLGNIKFKGTFTGLYNDFYAYGDFSSALGRLSTDLSLRHDDKKDKELYKGKIRSYGFDFGRFFNAPLLGKVTANVVVDGEGFTLEDVAAKLSGTITTIDFNNYTYSNVAIEGNVAKQVFKGKLAVKDDNIDFDFIGKVDFTKKLPNLDFIATVNKADLGALHFVKTDKKTDLSTQVIINVTGNNIDNLIGQINFDNTVYKENDDVYKLSVFNLISEEENGVKSIKLFSDFCDARIRGSFKILELPSSLQNLMNNYLPAYVKKSKSKSNPLQIFEYSFLFKMTEAVTRLFAPEIKIAPRTSITGNYNSSLSDLSLKGNSSRLELYGYVLQNWNIDAETKFKELDVRMTSDRFYLTDSLWLTDLSLNTSTLDDSVNLQVTWDNQAKTKLYKGDLNAFLRFNSDQQIQFKILPSVFVISDSIWDVSKTNEVLVDSSRISIRDLMFEHDKQSIAVNGIISKNKQDQVVLDLNNFNLANLNVITRPLGLKLRGTVTGQSRVQDAYNNMIFTSNTTFNSLFLNDEQIGDGDVESVWDKAKEALYLHGTFTLGIIPNILFSGYYYPKRQEENLDMEVNLQAIQMRVFEPYIQDYCSDFKGQFSGAMTLKGSVKKPLVAGKLNVNAKKVTVSYLNTSYHFNHDIIIENNSFGIEDMVLYDINNNKAIATGKLYHDNFKDFQLDYDIRATKFMCLNTTEAENNLYYGKAYVTGIINIFGFVKDELRIDANVKTEKITSNDKSDKVSLLSKTEITKLFIPLSGPAEVSENNFITFVKKDSVSTNKNIYNVKLGGLALNFDLEVTPDAEVQLIFDQKVGDVIKARGEGNIKLQISSRGEFKMYGDYVIENGDYLFTLQNIINKRFDIEKGSVIKWSGVPYKADVNINAVYKARASLKPFFPTDSSSTYKRRYPVDLKLAMTDDLLSPEINFDINIPTVDAGIRQQVMSYINTDAEMNRQVFSLLILNSFVTPPQLTGAGTGPGVASATYANTSELLSNQLSNMLSKISNDFDIGVNYRPGDEISKEELGVALSTQLFDDRLSIDGNLGVNNNNNATTNNTNNIVGDVNVDYKITDDGKFRIKAFNKANDNNQIYTAGPYTQGVGVLYREEFDTIGQLYKRYLGNLRERKKNKQNSTKTDPLPQDN